MKVEIHLPVLIENMTGDEFIVVHDGLKGVAAYANLQLERIFNEANGRELA